MEAGIYESLRGEVFERASGITEEAEVEDLLDYVRAHAADDLSFLGAPQRAAPGLGGSHLLECRDVAFIIQVIRGRNWELAAVERDYQPVRFTIRQRFE